MQQPKEAGLAELIFPLSPGEFRADYWPHKPFLTHTALPGLKPLIDAPELQDASSLLRRPSKRVTVRFKRKKDGIPMTIPVDSSAAAGLFASGGVTLVIDGVEKGVPAASALLAALPRELETPCEGLTCNAYLSPVGEGTGMHFDKTEVFIVQIRGRKRWKFAVNTHFPYPTENYVVGSPVNPKMRTAFSGLPSRMPPEAATVDLAPGSVLFLPRGYWHDTHTLEDSIHLTFTLQSKTWKDVLLEALADRLAEDVEWRKPAVGFSGSGASAEAARRRLKDLWNGVITGSGQTPLF